MLARSPLKEGSWWYKEDIIIEVRVLFYPNDRTGNGASYVIVVLSHSGGLRIGGVLARRLGG
jgi:hypothetical protein